MVSRLTTDPIAEARRQWDSRGWDAAALGMTTVTSIIRAQQLMLTRVDAALKPHRLSFARFEMLRLLAFTRGGMLPLASAITRLQVHPASATNTVDRLRRDALLRKDPHPRDGRAAMLVLTEEGRVRVEAATTSLNAVFAALGMSGEDEASLVGILTRFRRDAGDFDDDSPA